MKTAAWIFLLLGIVMVIAGIAPSWQRNEFKKDGSSQRVNVYKLGLLDPAVLGVEDVFISESPKDEWTRFVHLVRFEPVGLSALCFLGGAFLVFAATLNLLRRRTGSTMAVPASGQ